MVTWDTAADWDGRKDESGMAHESIANTDHSDASVLKHGYTYQQPDLMDGLVGWWLLHDDSAQDYSGNGNHGTLNGDPTTGVAGRGGLQAMGFTGSQSQYIHIGTPSELDFSAGDSFTITGWFRLRSNSSSQAVISNWGSDSPNIVFRAYGNDNGIEFGVRDDTNSSEIETTYTPNANQWYFVAGTYDGSGNAELFVDAVKEGDASASLSGSLTNDTWVLGNRSSVENTPLDGNTCDIRVYNRVLTSAEIQTLYDWGATDLARPRTDGVARYPLDGDATDVWGGNDGTTGGGLSWSSDAIRGQSGDFDGADDYIEIGDAFYVNEHTIATWVKPDTLSQDGMVVGKGSEIYLWFNSNNNAIRHELHIDGAWQGDARIPYSKVSSNEWIFIAATYDGSNVRIYLNGIEVDSVSQTGSIDDQTTRWTIGETLDDNSGRLFDGHIDDVRIYDYALEPYEVFELYQWGTFGRDMRQMTVRA